MITSVFEVMLWLGSGTAALVAFVFWTARRELKAHKKP
jgi:hypothetical protein